MIINKFFYSILSKNKLIYYFWFYKLNGKVNSESDFNGNLVKKALKIQ